MIFKDDELTFESTGRKEYCFREGLSCHPDSPESIYYGSDGAIPQCSWEKPLTPAEKREAADWMIERWKRWAEINVPASAG
jgi:hypothetical protein